MLLAAALLAVNLIIVPLYEYEMLFAPSLGNGKTPQSIKLAYTDVFIDVTSASKIHGWFVENKKASKVILVFHGKGGDMSERINLIEKLYSLPAAVFIFDYEGYGQSSGSPSEDSFYQDALAAYDFLITQKKFKSSQIIILGSSLGAGPALYLAQHKKAGGVVLQKAFTSVADLAKLKCLFFQRPYLWLRSKFNNLQRMDRINAPLLIIHSRTDNVVPYEMAEKLFNKAKEPKTLVALEGLKHDDLIATPEYLIAIRNFLLGLPDDHSF